MWLSKLSEELTFFVQIYFPLSISPYRLTDGTYLNINELTKIKESEFSNVIVNADNI